MNWRKSSYSGANGQCVEVGDFRKSSHSGYNGDCVEVGCGDSVIGVRDSKDCGDGPVLTFSSEAWTAFTASLAAAGVADQATLA